MTKETASQRKWRLVRERQEAKAAERRRAEKRRKKDWYVSGPGGSMPRDPDGMDRDDLGLSPDY